MEEEISNKAERELQEMRYNHSLSIEDMLNLAGQVEDWRATSVCRHKEKEYSHFKPQVIEFQGVVGNITLDLESSSANSFSRWYRITIHTPLNTLGNYKEKEGKCSPRLIQFYSCLESRYVQDYFKRVMSDMKSGLEEARRLIKNK